ncbi:MAG: hypothetical protein AAGK32_17415, partial [Actinomycetota bacterium]
KFTNLLPEAAPQWTVRRGAEQLRDHMIANGMTADVLEGPSLQRVKYLRSKIDNGAMTPDLRWMPADDPTGEADPQLDGVR